MQFFEEIQALLLLQKPFVYYVKPNETAMDIIRYANLIGFKLQKKMKKR